MANVSASLPWTPLENPRWQKDRGAVALPDRTAAQSTYAVFIMITQNTL